MRQLKTITLLGVAAVFCMGTGYTQDNSPQDPGSMSAEQRQAAKQARREQWENMSEEERAAARAQREERKAKRKAAHRERFESMSEEEREAVRARRQNMSEEERQALRKRRQERAGTDSMPDTQPPETD